MKSTHVIQIRSYKKGEKSETTSIKRPNETNVSLMKKIKKYLGVND